jgi:MFS family permease
MSSPPPAATPTRARYVLIAWLCGLSLLLYLDRICMSKAVKPIREELDLSKTEMSYVMMAFTLAYGIFAVPAGQLGDRFGPRIVLAVMVTAWSAFTGLTGLAMGLWSLIVIRFLFGAAEAGAFPNAARVLSGWYPVGERGRVQGTMLAFAQMGAVAAPIATAYLIDGIGWRWTFFAFALVGVAWAAGFYWWFRDDPANHPRVSPEELTEIQAGEPPPPTNPGPVPWRAVAHNRGIIVLAAVMVLAAFFTYFFYTWFPTYLEEARKVDDITSGWLAALALAGSGVGMLIGGWLSDRITQKSADPIRDRRRVSAVGFFIAAVCMFLGTRCESAVATSVLWSAAMCAMHIQLPNWWSAIIPQAGRHTATLFGLTNGIGVFGALASQGFVGIFADWQERRGLRGREQWDPISDVYVIVLVLGGIAWLLYRFTPLPEPPEAPKDDEVR